MGLWVYKVDDKTGFIETLTQIYPLAETEVELILNICINKKQSESEFLFGRRKFKHLNAVKIIPMYINTSKLAIYTHFTK